MKLVTIYDETGVCDHAVVDDGDFELVAARRWNLNPKGYAVAWSRSNGRNFSTLMHRLILGLKSGDRIEVDHHDRDHLNNRRDNLRMTTRAGNSQNLSSTGYRGGRSAFRGVSPSRGRWRAQVTLDGRAHHLGRYDTEEEAAQVAADFRREHMPLAVER